MRKIATEPKFPRITGGYLARRPSGERAPGRPRIFLARSGSPKTDTLKAGLPDPPPRCPAMTSQPPPALPGEDPLISRYVEEALALVQGRLQPEDIEVYRQRLYLFYETSPIATDLLNEIREAKRQGPLVKESGDIVRRDDDALAGAVSRKQKRAQGEGQ